jgi:hypothetical protein
MFCLAYKDEWYDYKIFHSQLVYHQIRLLCPQLFIFPFGPPTSQRLMIL